MSLSIDEDGTIYIHQGDSGEIIISGIPTDNDYTIYFAIKDKNRTTIGSELFTKSNNKPFVKIALSAEFTDLLTVPEDEDFTIYNYGIKMCSDEKEDTLYIANSDYGQLNNLIVYPKLVEGV